jgi:hypothetical protein
MEFKTKIVETPRVQNKKPNKYEAYVQQIKSLPAGKGIEIDCGEDRQIINSLRSGIYCAAKVRGMKIGTSVSAAPQNVIKIWRVEESA